MDFIISALHPNKAVKKKKKSRSLEDNVLILLSKEVTEAQDVLATPSNDGKGTNALSICGRKVNLLKIKITR